MVDFEGKQVGCCLDGLFLSIFFYSGLLLLQGERSKAFHPSENIIESVEFAGTTTNRVDFDEKEVSA